LAIDVHCANGLVSEAILARYPETKIVALQADPSLDSLARSRVQAAEANVYFRPGNFDDVTAMADQLYDLTVANLVLGEVVPDWQAGLAELIRVSKPGGEIVATFPLRGTWNECDQLFAEVLRDSGLPRELALHERMHNLRPRPSEVANGMRELGLSADDWILVHERFELLFAGSREFLFAPVIEQGPLRMWRAILSKSPKPQELVWRLTDAIDTYYDTKVMAVTVEAAVLRVRRPGPRSRPLAQEHWRRFPSLMHVWQRQQVVQTPAPVAGPASEPDAGGELEIDIAIDDDDAPPSSSVAPRLPPSFKPRGST
jgi:SAM-dependent methyltransferase